MFESSIYFFKIALLTLSSWSNHFITIDTSETQATTLGHFAQSSDQLLFFSSRQKNNTTYLSLSINNKVLQALFDFNSNQAHIYANDVLLTQSEKKLLKNFSVSLRDKKFKNHQRTSVNDVLLVQLAGYWSTTPKGFRLNDRQFNYK
ncbi:MAG: hypothetical protein AAGB12_12945 [Pseudomonadota bacterium]